MLCLIVLTIQTAEADAACTGAWTLFNDVYYILVEEMQRGAPSSIASAFFAEFKGQIGRWAIDNSPPDAILGQSCVPDSVTAPLFTADGRLVSFQNSIDILKADGYPPSYLSRAEYPTLPEIPDTIMTAVEVKWNLANIFLSEPPLAFYTNEHNSFPNIFALLYDPHRDHACYQFHRWGLANGHSMNAEVLTTRMIGLVVRLHLLGVSEDASFQMLLHHSAYIFDGMRCCRQHYDQLSIPLAFSQAYSELAATLTKDLDTTAVPHIPDSVVKAHFLGLVNLIAYYRAWGTNGAFVVNNGVTGFKTWKQLIFAPWRLKKVRNEMSLNARQLVMWKQPIAAPSGNSTNRNQSPCLSGWRWEDQATMSNTVEEKCCSELCYDGALVPSVLGYTIANCCNFCNQVSCFCDHEAFDHYVAVVPAFGELATQSVPLMI